MSLNEEQLERIGEHIRLIEEMAGLFFSPELIAINLELTEEETEKFMADIENKDTRHFRASAYFKGWLEAEITLRKAVKQSALNGSSPSQQMMLNYKREGKL